MKTSWLLLAGAGVIALMYFGGLGAAANVLQYYITSVDFTGITTGRIVLMVQNPSNTAIVLNSMAGTVTANGTQIGNISNFQGGITIPSNQQTAVPIFVNLNLSALLSNLYTMLTQPNGANNINFVIAGNANVNGGLIVPFTINQNINV